MKTSPKKITTFIVCLTIVFLHAVQAQSFNSEEQIDALLSKETPKEIYTEHMDDEDGQNALISLHQYKTNPKLTMIHKKFIPDLGHSWSYYYYDGKLIKASDLRKKGTSQHYYYQNNKVFSINPSSEVASENVILERYAKSMFLLSRDYKELLTEKYNAKKAGDSIWRTDNFEETIAKAKREGKLMLISFQEETDNTRKVQQEYFEKEEFLSFAQKGDILLLKLVEKDSTFSFYTSKLKVNEFPATLLVDPTIDDWDVSFYRQNLIVYYEFYQYNTEVSVSKIITDIESAAKTYVTPRVAIDPFYAIEKEETDFMIYALDKKKYDINKMKKNKTLAMYAAENNNKRAIDILKERKADLKIKNKKGETAADYARKEYHYELAKYIESL